MALDKRAQRAKRRLAQGVKEAGEIQTDPAKTRSTATRGAYKAKAEAADEALAILSERP